MEQELEYNGVRYVIGPEKDRKRLWTVYPGRGKPMQGLVGQCGAQGSFKKAVMEARKVIDGLLHPEQAA